MSCLCLVWSYLSHWIPGLKYRFGMRWTCSGIFEFEIQTFSAFILFLNKSIDSLPGPSLHHCPAPAWTPGAATSDTHHPPGGGLWRQSPHPHCWPSAAPTRSFRTQWRGREDGEFCFCVFYEYKDWPSIQVCFLGVPHSHSSVLNNYYEVPWLLDGAKSMGMKIVKLREREGQRVDPGRSLKGH